MYTRSVNPSQASSSPFSTPRLSVARLHRDYLDGHVTIVDCAREVLRRLAAADDNPLWITRVAESALLARAAECDAWLARYGAEALERFPLLGVPYAVKDNIDVASLPTTAACAAFAYTPQCDATAVARLEAAGAMLVGKTNLDQFATGLVGTRSPYGVVHHPEFPERIAGGSSSGSAVAVAQGLVAFALGTDTAGSGRVPAGFNGIVGLKPSRGLVSTHGLSPACRTLDCISVFAGDVVDAWHVLGVLAGEDAQDSYSRIPFAVPPCSRAFRIAVPQYCEFYGDVQSQAAFEAACESLAQLPFVQLQTVETEAVFAAAQLLYQGPWVAERRAALGDFFDVHAADIEPSVRSIIAAADGHSAVDAFLGEYRLAEHRAAAARLFATVDALLVPTAPTHPRIVEVLNEPIAINARLGHYTNFANLLDLAAIAIPAARRGDGLPFGVTLLAPAGSDHRLAAMAQVLAEALAGGAPRSAVGSLAFEPLPMPQASLDLVVVGAHLLGQPLNWQLLECGARRVRSCRTAPHYRLYALANTAQPKPGLVRCEDGGAAIEVEVWRLPAAQLGRFIAWVGSPLAIGTLELEDGGWLKGFVCEPLAVNGAEDISAFGGWRAYRADAGAAP
ncbi:allophanate hydrolase [Algiphilus sp. W345]|uniref:Allophanate hydrolase n=1 Tax=Banduia mediterranea TaxID=3075609 RepID=A0ABU2WIA6_9GAMM|nr:allophanate hydrolase [Algiphilus sp. W345]MDT0497305.1 allophanate hydrolase [Algiphilus sp. W345]